MPQIGTSARAIAGTLRVAIWLLAGIWPAALLVAVWPTASTAAVTADPSGYSGAFPRLETGARAAALAGNMTALAEGSEALLWNAAGLVLETRPQLSFSYADLYDLGLVSHTVVQFDFPRPRREIVWDRGDIRRVTSPAPAARAFGLGVSGLRAEAGAETYRENQFALAYAQPVSAGFYAGAVVRILSAQSSAALAEGSGYAVDLGLLRPWGEFRLGVSAAGLLSSLSWEEGEQSEGQEPLPTRWSAALAWLPARWPVRAAVQGDWSTTEFELRQTGAAVEWQPLESLVLRGGVRQREDALGTRTEPAGGAGFRLGSLSLDYGYLSNAHDLGDTHRWTAAIRF